MSDEERRFTREEISVVLREVAKRPLSTTPREGLTKAELREVVREAGLDVTQVEGALAELEGRHKAEARLLGLDLWVVVQRRIPAKLDSSQLQRASKRINRSIGTLGQSEIDEDGLSWFGRHVNVSITQEGERVVIQIEERFHNTTRTQLAMAAMASVLTAIFVLVSMANVGLEPLGILLGPLFPALAYLAVRAVHRARIAATQERLELLAEQLVEALSQPAVGPRAIRELRQG